MPTHRIVVKGKVQGVGFRYYTSRTAERLGLTGEVWNRRDGAVEMVAHHLSPERLAFFEDALSAGPGEILDVEVSEAPDEALDSFRIGPTR